MMVRSVASAKITKFMLMSALSAPRRKIWWSWCKKGLFREDLYYRLNVLTLNLPPLRDCPQDIMPLTELFVARFADEQGVPRPKLSADLSTGPHSLRLAG